MELKLNHENKKKYKDIIEKNLKNGFDQCQDLDLIIEQEIQIDQQKFLTEDVVVNIVYREEKKNICRGEDCILIDDLESNIEDWISYGGIGILHKDAASTMDILWEKEIL